MSSSGQGASEREAAFPAGRLFRVGGSNVVRADARLGVMTIRRAGDGGVQAWWRAADMAGDGELCGEYAGGDCAVERVRQAAGGRVHVLRPSRRTAGASHVFFWLQGAAGDDGAVIRSVDRVVAAGQGVRRLLAGLRGLREALPVRLGDVVTPEAVAPVLADARLAAALAGALPPGVAPAAAVRSPQFRQALAALSHVPEGGQAGAALAAQLGLDPRAGSSVVAFLRAIEQRRAAEDGDDQEMH